MLLICEHPATTKGQQSVLKISSVSTPQVQRHKTYLQVPSYHRSAECTILKPQKTGNTHENIGFEVMIFAENPVSAFGAFQSNTKFSCVTADFWLKIAKTLH
ncbi:MAG: hypothetical protein KME60_09640 [Cyanomargarita calcarea GSE-NOS-MK-12-04C]|jgi:hypothetical protein|uniref:Uncharacterized protein n=1 Tax=Cyanomargarita calcarea GSE-NOS-MK-12-04C TaxID=2839659 RepID=A0A951UUC3_9CYAN|nr:hypothetical protein [Cyanomargarita calcarea GSE-NOS-MK-12-04C]